MTRYLPWGVLLLVGGLWLWQHDRGIKERVGLQVSVDSFSRALASSRNEDRLRQARGDSLQHQVDSLKSAKSKVLRRIDTVQVRVAVQESVFVSRLPDSLRAPFDTLIAVKDHIINELRGIIRGDSVSEYDRQSQLALRGASLAECQTGLAEAIRQRDRAMKLAQPGLLTRVVRSLPAVAIGALGALILRR